MRWPWSRKKPVEIKRVEVASEDPDRFNFGMIEAIRKRLSESPPVADYGYPIRLCRCKVDERRPFILDTTHCLLHGPKAREART